MAKLEEVTLTYLSERIRFDGSNTAILLCQMERCDSLDVCMQDLVVKCECEPDELVSGLSYRFYGRYTEHHKYGRQFVAKTFVRTMPHSRAGIVRYLMQAPRVGQITALALWDKFGGDAVRILREQPDVAAVAVGGSFTVARAEEAAEYLRQEQAIENTLIDLIDVLGSRGFPKSLPKRLVAEWQGKAAAMVKRNPYQLLKFHGCGFLRCDQLFLDLGGMPGRLKRQALCAWDTLAGDTAGHTWFPPQVAERGIRSRVAGVDVQPLKALKLAKRAGLLIVHRNGSGDVWLAEAQKAKSEQIAAERVKAWLEEPAKWPSLSSLAVSEHQLEKLQQALYAPLALFTGGPGTGKTYSGAQVLAVVRKQHGADMVAVAAPTGKAAVRITEAMTQFGISIRAKTIHSLLGVESHSESGGWGFKHNAANPLPYKFIIVDEASMIDTDLAAALFSACAPGTHMLLIGDTAQLPPVGHGAPLRDLIAAGVPNGELTEIRRNSGDIVRACHEIRQGKLFTTSGAFDPDAGLNLRLRPACSSQAALDQVVKTLRTIATSRMAHPVRDCQVIVAVNDKSELSRRAVNKRLQQELNPGGYGVSGNPFRVGDKIVCLRNGFFPVVEDAPSHFNQEENDGKVFVANGEQGFVKHVELKITIAQLEAPSRLVKIPRGGGDAADSQSGGDGDNSDKPSATGCQWDLAYAISAHKSQGSEWPVVLVALDEYPGARMVCSREWIYTSISRAKKACFLVGKIATAHGMVHRQAIAKRKTFLKELITH